MRSSLLAAAAATLLSTGTAGAAAGCTVLTDPADDVVFSAVVPGLPDPHVDVRTVSVATTANGLTFRIAATDLLQGRQGEWRVTFVSRGTRLFAGAGTGAWANLGGGYRGTFGFRAGVDGRTNELVTGTVDHVANEIRVDVPWRAYGGAAPRRGDVLRGFAIEAREMLVNVVVGPANVAHQFSLVDSGSSNKTYRVGAGC